MQRDALAGICTGCMAIPQTVCKSDDYKLLSTNCSSFADTIRCQCHRHLQALLLWLACLQHLVYTPVLQPSADTRWWEAQSTWWVAHPHPWQARQVLSSLCSLSVHGSRQNPAGQSLQEIWQLLHTCYLPPTTANMRALSKSAEPPCACCSCAPPAAGGLCCVPAPLCQQLAC